VWQQLNISWAIFFVLLGCANLYVVYNFDTNIWVNFKLFGTMGLTILFIIAQGIYISRHQKPVLESEE
jgi:intracellular septation protein